MTSNHLLLQAGHANEGLPAFSAATSEPVASGVFGANMVRVEMGVPKGRCAMRTSSVAAVVLTLLLTGSGKLNAQTADIQQSVETKLALTRLGYGVRIAESFQVLAQTALEESVKNLQRTGAVLRRLYGEFTSRSGKPMRGEEKP